MPTRWLATPCAALCVFGLSSVADAQPSPLTRASATIPVVTVALTQDGTFDSPDSALAHGLSIVDRQSVDLDGDGDADVLAFVDVREGSPTTGPHAGRGAVVFFREGERSWRGRTVASVPALPFESAYNWGDVTQRRGGVATVVRLLYSAAYRGRFAHAEYRVRFDRDGMHVMQSSPHGRPFSSRRRPSAPARSAGRAVIARTSAHVAS